MQPWTLLAGDHAAATSHRDRPPASLIRRSFPSTLPCTTRHGSMTDGRNTAADAGPCRRGARTMTAAPVGPRFARRTMQPHDLLARVVEHLPVGVFAFSA